jgi:hypothetical protein
MRYIAGDGGPVLSGDGSRSRQRLDLVLTLTVRRFQGIIEHLTNF